MGPPSAASGATGNGTRTQRRVFSGLSQLLAEVHVRRVRGGHALPAEDLAVALLLVEARGLEGERRDEDVRAAPRAGLGLELGEQPLPQPVAAGVLSDPRHADAGGDTPRPA